MTQDEAAALLDALMVAVNRAIDARLGDVAKSEICIVRYVDGNNVYIRQLSNVSEPTYASPASISQLDDGDILIPNISGHTLVVGDSVEVVYASAIDDAVIARKLAYSPVDPSGEGTFNKNVTIQKPSGETGVSVERTDTGAKVALEIGTGGANHGVYSWTGTKWIIYNDANGKTYIPTTPIVGGHSTPIGSVLTADLASASTIASGTALSIASISLPPGTWVLTGRVRFSANANGFRQANINATNGSSAANIRVAPVSGSVTQLSLTKIVTVSSTTTYYLNAYQNSGSSLSLEAGSDGEINSLRAVRIA